MASMKCENCEKRDATVHLTEIRDGVKHEMHLCEQCATAKGVPGKASFSFQELLAGIAGSQATKVSRRAQETACPTCGITLAEFQASGRFGCADDYAAFRDDIIPLIEKIHDSTQHTGKVPSRADADISTQKEIRHLQAELKKAVKKEDYEKAAELRDRVRRMEEQAGRESDASKTEE